MQTLTVSLIQSHLFAEDKDKNLQNFEAKFATIPASSNIVILPEMFNTGFSMNVNKLAETMQGETIEWMRQQAVKYRKIITGSLIIKEDNKFFNRLIWMQPDGKFYHYDKRHLFGFVGEDRHYNSGEKKCIFSVNGWRVCPQICYDLRFPVWARQSAASSKKEGHNSTLYDILFYVACWPQRRNIAWNILLRARAIENQCFVIGVNRIGKDANGIYHSGDSSIIHPSGHILWHQADEEVVFTQRFSKQDLGDFRSEFPFLKDADNFVIL